MRYLFDDFSLDADRFELSRGDTPIRVEPQVIELLLLLVENAGRMISKDEIIEVVWRGRVVSEAAVSSRIKSARQALGDDGQAQKYIRTVHKKGFRFAGEVRRDEGEVGPGAPGIESAAPVATAEATTTAGAPSGRPAVAVLPFVNLSSDPEQEYLSDGITSDVIARLCRHRWIDVVARNTSFGFKGRAVDVRDVGRLLAVAYVVEGSVQRAGNRIRVAVQLVDGMSGHTLWSERYDREMSDIFALQDEITEMIAARLEPEIGLSERSKLIQSRPPDLHAWDCYHLGIFHFFKFTGPDNIEAQRLLLRAQELDPQFGEAFAWWAYALILGMVYWETPPTPELLDQALAACDRALEIDRQNASFHALRARVLLARCEYRHAITENQAAIALNPSFAAAHCGLGDSLAYEKRYEEAVECFDRAIALSPNDPQLWAFYSYGALALIFKGDYDTAVAWTDRAAGIPNCQYWAWAHRCVAMALAGHLAAAGRARDHLLQLMPGFTIGFARQKLFYLREAEHVERYLEGLRLAGVPAG